MSESAVVLDLKLQLRKLELEKETTSQNMKAVELTLRDVCVYSISCFLWIDLSTVTEGDSRERQERCCAYIIKDTIRNRSSGSRTRTPRSTKPGKGHFCSNNAVFNSSKNTSEESTAVSNLQRQVKGLEAEIQTARQKSTNLEDQLKDVCASGDCQSCALTL